MKRALLENAVDLEAFDKRAGETLLVLEDVVKSLKRDGKIEGLRQANGGRRGRFEMAEYSISQLNTFENYPLQKKL